MTAKTMDPTRYRVTGEWTRLIQLVPPEAQGAQSSQFRGGDVLPPWVKPEDVSHLLEFGYVEEIGADS